MARWQKGKGWGWIWGPEDEIGALNAITPVTVMAALQLAKNGRTADLASWWTGDPFAGPAALQPRL